MADNKDEIRCPACNNLMKKIFVADKNKYVDICVNGCGGIFFDNRELTLFDEQNEDISLIEQELAGKVFAKTDETIQRICPVCNAKMIKNYSSIKKEVMIDECYTCGAKFLDNAELEKIRKEYSSDSERTDDVMRHLNSVWGEEILEAEMAAKNVKFSPGLKLVMKMFSGR